MVDKDSLTWLALITQMVNRNSTDRAPGSGQRPTPAGEWEPRERVLFGGGVLSSIDSL